MSQVAAALVDLRAWLEAVEEIGELRRIDAEVEPLEEMGGLAYLVARTEGAPALLFNRVRGASPGVRSLFNLLGTSLPRIALALGLDPGLAAGEVVQQLRVKLKERRPPLLVPAESAPVNEHVLRGADLDLEAFAPPRHWPLDGGRYIGTAAAGLRGRWAADRLPRGLGPGWVIPRPSRRAGRSRAPGPGGYVCGSQ